MKLSALKAEIRKLDGPPKIRVLLGKIEVYVPVMKGALCDELDRAYDKNGNAETGLWIRKDGYFMKEESRDL